MSNIGATRIRGDFDEAISVKSITVLKIGVGAARSPNGRLDIQPVRCRAILGKFWSAGDETRRSHG